MTAVAPPKLDLQAARALATGLKRQWRREETGDAAAALAEHPELASFKSLVVELAYEEFLIREKVGPQPDVRAFAARFPAFRSSIAKMLDAHQLLLERPELLTPPTAAWPELETTFEGLKLVSELGRGSFGRAYLAFDPGTDRLCVLKLTAGASTEARVIGRLAHPHVTDVYWARAVGRRTAVCMPFVGVSTLSDVIAAAFPKPRNAMPGSANVIVTVAEADGLAEHADRRSTPVVRPNESYAVGACAVGALIADAVAYLHGRGIAHGDLKPSNVVIGPGGAPHLIDFNLALDAALSHVARGTPAYMAPELLDAALGERSTEGIDVRRADLFSLGVVLYELFAGELPFPRGKSATFGDLAEAVRRGPPPIPIAMPSAVAAVVAKCLAAAPADRPASAAEVAAALDRAVRSARNRGRRTVQMAAVVAASIALVAFGTAAYSARPEAHRTPVEAKPETAEGHFDLAIKLLHADRVAESRAEFVRAYEMSRDPWCLAYIAYGTAREGQAVLSAAMGRQAIQEGADSVEVRNNLGYALAQSKQPGPALAELAIALNQHPGLQAAHYNRAMIHYLDAFKNNMVLKDETSAREIAAALASEPRSADLHLHAARIFAASSKLDPRYSHEAVEHLKAAVRTGKDPVKEAKDIVFVINLGTHPEFASIPHLPRGSEGSKTVSTLRLIEPIADRSKWNAIIAKN